MVLAMETEPLHRMAPVAALALPLGDGGQLFRPVRASGVPGGNGIDIYCIKTTWHLVLRQRRLEASRTMSIGERLDSAARHLKISHKEQKLSSFGYLQSQAKSRFGARIMSMCPRGQTGTRLVSCAGRHEPEPLAGAIGKTALQGYSILIRGVGILLHEPPATVSACRNVFAGAWADGLNEGPGPCPTL